MEKEKKISFISIIKVTWFSIMMFIVYVLSNLYLGLNSFDPVALFIVMLPIALSLYLFIEYLCFDIKKNIIIKSDRIQFIKRGESKIIDYTQIDKIYVFIPSSLMRNAHIKLLPTEFFYYAKIETISNEVFYITSLIDTEFYRFLKKDILLTNKLIIKKGFFNSILLNNLP